MGNVLATGCTVSENDGSGEILKGNEVKMENVNENSGQIEDCGMSEVSSLRDNFAEVVEENGFHVGRKRQLSSMVAGQIYDFSDASDLALKTMQKGKLLVAYFGDGNFAWGNPLQLKQFLENFKVLSKMSDLIGFLSAVEEAVRLIGGTVEQFLVCDEMSLFSSVAVNSGIREGVIVPDVRREIVSSLVLEMILVSCSDMLKIEVLKRKMFVFYRCKGKFDLANYDEDRFIMGLEHKDEESCQRSLRKCSGFVRSRKYGEVSKIETAEEEISNGTRLSLSNRKSKRGLVDDDGIEKREESKDSNHLVENEKKDDFCTPLASVCKRLRVDVSSSVKRNNGNGESLVHTGLRERKKSKYLSPEYMTDSIWRLRKSRVQSESNQIQSTRAKDN